MEGVMTHYIQDKDLPCFRGHVQAA